MVSKSIKNLKEYIYALEEILKHTNNNSSTIKKWITVNRKYFSVKEELEKER